jgi:phosphoribosylanthranilate isomerase
MKAEQEAASIIKNLRPSIRGDFITYLPQPGEVIEFCNALGASVVQLHGDLEASELCSIKQQQPRLAIIKSLVIGLYLCETLLKTVNRTVACMNEYVKKNRFDPNTSS